MEDSYRAKGMRKRLVDTLGDKGINDPDVLAAIEKIPRHLFLDTVFLEHAYEDKAFPIGAEQTISQPYTVAVQSTLLNVKKGDKILEIGTGSGYQTAVLCELGAKVFSIERQKLLYRNSSVLLRKLKYTSKVELVFGDGFKGLPTFAPFDGIIVTCGAPYMPDDLLRQLKVGAKMVIPVGEGEVQKMIVITRKSETDFSKQEFGDFKFVPMLKNTNN